MLGLGLQRSKPMANPAFSNTQPQQIERLLAAARETIAEVPFCWVVTAAGDGGANARLVKAQPSGAADDFWTRWFLTPYIGRKAAEIRKAGRVTPAHPHHFRKTFFALAGPGALVHQGGAGGNPVSGLVLDFPPGVVAP